MIKKLSKAFTILRQEGPLSLARAIKDHVKWRFSPSSVNDYQLDRIQGTEQRWELIEQRLASSDDTLLDIGCNVGELTAKGANAGLFSVGLETNPESVRYARQAYDIEGVSFMRYTLSPENIHKLPQVDVVFVLSVYHYWYREHGPKKAEQMLEALGEKVNSKIFFEPPSRQTRYKRSSDIDITPPPITDMNENSIREYNMDLLERTLGDEYNCEFLGGTSRNDDEEGSRYMFVCERK